MAWVPLTLKFFYYLTILSPSALHCPPLPFHSLPLFIPPSAVCVSVCTCVHVIMSKSAGTLLEPILFHCGFWRIELQVFNLDSKCLYSLSCLTGPPTHYFLLSLAVLLDLLSLLQSLVELASSGW